MGLGALERSAGDVRARVDLRPYADEGPEQVRVSDLTPASPTRRSWSRHGSRLVYRDSGLPGR